MRWFLFLLVFAALALPSYAATLVDGATGDEVTIAVVTVVSAGESMDFLVTPDQEFELPSSRKSTLLLVRSNFSASYTHYAQLAAGADPKTILLSPGTLLIGQVRTTQDNLLAHVPVRIVCPSFTAQLETDDVGVFRTAVPADSCVIAAEANGAVGSAMMAFEQGVPASATIVVDYRIASVPQRPGLLAVAAIVLLALGLIAGFILWPRSRGEPYAGERVKTALKANEAAIVDALVARGGRATLSNLRSDLRMPRTSLLRTIAGLEQRNVLMKKEEHGKVIIVLSK